MRSADAKKAYNLSTRGFLHGIACGTEPEYEHVRFDGEPRGQQTKKSGRAAVLMQSQANLKFA